VAPLAAACSNRSASQPLGRTRLRAVLTKPSSPRRRLERSLPRWRHEHRGTDGGGMQHDNAGNRGKQIRGWGSRTAGRPSTTLPLTSFDCRLVVESKRSCAWPNGGSFASFFLGEPEKTCPAPASASLETSPLATVERGDREATRVLAGEVTVPLRFRWPFWPRMWVRTVALCLAV
jgi:hypothetical protein